jgi:uncharacterized protein YggE
MNLKRYSPLVLMLVASASSLAALEADTERRITVRGSAEVRVVPDEVVLTVGVESFYLELEDSKAENDRLTTSVIEAAKGNGIASEHIRTDYLSIEPRFDDRYDKNQELLGYVVRRTVALTLRDVSRFEDLLSEVLEAGANYVHGVDFRTTELRKHRDEARARAIEAAREKAQDLAGQLGQSIGKPLSIDEGYGGWFSSYGSWWGSRWAGGAAQNVIQSMPSSAAETEGPTAPGQISVSATINVTFELVDPSD